MGDPAGLTCVGGEWVAEPRRSTGNPFQSRPAAEEEPPPADAGCRPLTAYGDRGHTDDPDSTLDERPVGAGRSGWRPDSLGAGGVQCVEHGGDRHPDRTCRAGGGPDVLVVSGTTVAEAIAIDLSPAVLTSDAIVISSGGVQASFSATADPAAARVALHVPAGIGPGAVVHVEGLRVRSRQAVSKRSTRGFPRPKTGWPPGAGPRGSSGRVADAIVIDPSTDSVYTYNSGRVLIDHLGHFTFSEGFAAAFSPVTEIIFKASALPRNTQLRFPATIESQTGARLTTADGADGTLASGEARNRVIYTFAPSQSSRTAVDVFSFSPVLERTGPVGAGTGFYQVTIGPIGAAVPTRALPSTAVPRYDELLLPVLGPDLPASKTFLFPVERGVDTQTLHDLEHGDRCDTVDDPSR